MNSRERVLSFLNGQFVDRSPNMNIIMQYAAKKIGATYGAYTSDYHVLVEGNLACCREFGIDCVSVISDPAREISGMGCEISYPPDNVPTARVPLLETPDDLAKVKIVNPHDAPRMLDRIKAVELFMREVGNDYPIMGWVEGAFATACSLRGLGDMLMDTLSEPDFVTELLEKTFEQNRQFALAQIEAGADIIGVGDAAASLVGPETYRQLVMPFEKRISEVIHNAGAKMKLHICGNINPLLPYTSQVGMDILDIDHMVSLSDALGLNPNAKVSGNFDPVSVMLQGTPDEVKQAVKRCISANPQRIIVMAGCEIPRETPEENMYACMEAIEEYWG